MSRPGGAAPPSIGTPADPKGAVASYFLSFNLYAFGNSLVGVFLNLFFLANYSFVAVLYFNLATFGIALAAYLIASRLVPRWAPRRLYILGLGVSIFVLVDLLAASGWMSNALVFGSFWGAATGVFYAGNNPMMHDLSRRSDRTPFVATNNLLNGLVALIAPVSAGALIQFSSFPGVLRYVWDFSVTSVFFLLSALVAVRMGTPAPSGPPAFPRPLRPTLGPGYGRYKLYFATSQLFVIPVGIVLPIYVFQVTGSYVVTGLFASYTILLSVAANLWFRKGYHRSGRFTAWAALGTVLASGVLFLPWGAPANAFLFATAYIVLTTPLNNRVMVDFMDLIDGDSGVDRVAAWSNREFYLGVGRLSVLAAMIGLSAYLLPTPMGLVWMLPAVSLYALVYLVVIGPGVPRRALPTPDLPAPAAAVRP